jgi:pimeloyl-ACP methyl ester carboxylesterase
MEYQQGCPVLNNVPHDTRRTRATRSFGWHLPRGGREYDIHASVRPHVLHGMVRLPEQTRAIVVVASSLPLALDDNALTSIGRELTNAGLGVALFDDLLPRRAGKAESLTAFDTQLLASRLAVVADLFMRDPRFRAFRFGALGHGGAGSATIMAAAEHPSFWRALVLHDVPLVAASKQLPRLTAPALLLQSRAAEEDNAFLVSRGSEAIRQFHTFGGRAVSDTARWRAVVRESRRWFARHLLGDTH